MKTEMEEKTTIHTKFWISTIIWAIFIACFILLVAKVSLVKIEDKRFEKIQNSISEILKDEAQVHSLLPDILIINIPKNEQNLIIDSLQKYLSLALADRYLSNTKNIIQKEGLQPYLTFLDNPKNLQKISLTKQQLTELKKHIEFLVSTVDNAIESSKANIDTEFNKINTWVTIWVGVIGFLGIFLPIVINFRSFSTLQKLEKDSREANKNATHAKGIIEKYKNDLHCIPGIKKTAEDAQAEVTKLQGNISKAEEQISRALSTSEKAISLNELQNKLLVALNTLGKLKEVDNIYSTYGDNAIESVKNNFISVYNVLALCKENGEHELIIAIIQEIGTRTRLLSSNKFINRDRTDLFNKLALSISNKLQQPWTKTSFEEFLSEFDIFIKSI
jgi:hypothetical protein